MGNPGLGHLNGNYLELKKVDFCAKHDYHAKHGIRGFGWMVSTCFFLDQLFYGNQADVVIIYTANALG